MSGNTENLPAISASDVDYGVTDPDIAAMYAPAVSELANRTAARNLIAVTFFTDESGTLSAETLGDSAFTDLVLSDACGTVSSAWMAALLNQLSRSGGKLTPEERANRLSAGIAFLQGIAPKNEVEAALAAQMFAVNDLVQTVSQRAAMSESAEGAKVWFDQVNKLGRTFAAQVEALAKIRGGGKQIVQVTHTHNHIDARNSQNVIAKTVSGDARGAISGNHSQPHTAASDVPGDPFMGGETLWSQDPSFGVSLSGASDQGQSPLPNAWRQKSWRTPRPSERPVRAWAVHQGSRRRASRDKEAS
ncbi:hypothetical protein ABENE_23030 [Asticcacaulis benevestitus DSM 16100 = ATCC BAA-896]|uniref:Uncharacterized protein n=1 Tax=Asticcacaulis benevestitus DSM 16100 = ATCC BAA-896 TaxID=1121022 RepID=V4N9S2_9CAUL|nr:hypothetical protein [Asticcacaulis benevestitus]ESQ78652.1 hypothetical protein ABENE_23030 [Asticcacaulis benevestitus DSM 16100 = ATCC BAA-896]